MGHSCYISRKRWVSDCPVRNEIHYRKIPIISPGLYLFKRLFWWAYFRGSLFLEGLNIEGNFSSENGLDLAVQTA